MLQFSNAKINLGLNIVEKRADGYHNIESIFYPIAWADVLEILPASEFSFDSSGLRIPGNVNQNLIVKAFQLLKKEYNFTENVKIHLHKTLPMGAGIGGGSSNGAFALKMLNEILNLNLENEKLCHLAEQLGSDCPFFIENSPKYCFDKGTRFENISLSLKGKFIILVNPEIHISTQEAYSGIVPHYPVANVKDIVQQPIETWKGKLINDFEEPILNKYPVISEIKNALYAKGALYASMTGSGSTLYGIFENEVDLHKDFDSYTYWSGFLQ